MLEFQIGERTVGNCVSEREFVAVVGRIFGHDPARVLPQSLRRAELKAPRPLDTSLCVAKASNALGRRLPGVHAGLERFGVLRSLAAGYAHA